jgi:lysophospholipase L1-like esterase
MGRLRSCGIPFFVGLLLLAAQSAVLADSPVLEAQKTKKRDKGEKSDKASVRPVPRDMKWWVDRENHLNEAVKQNSDAQLLFIGDSITQGWEGGGKKVWEKYYGKRHAVNLGIGGDQTQHVLWRLDHGNLEGLSPKLAVVMIGTNNAGSGNNGDQIAAGVKAVVQKLRTKVPATKILLLGIFPRGKDSEDSKRKANEAANAKIAQLEDGKHVYFLDIGNRFLSGDGTLPKEVMPDFLHPNAKGYEIWAAAIDPEVKKLMGEAQ